MDARGQSHFISISNLKSVFGKTEYKKVSFKIYGSCRRFKTRSFIELSLAICQNLPNSIQLTRNNNFCLINFIQLNLLTSYSSVFSNIKISNHKNIFRTCPTRNKNKPKADGCDTASDGPSINQGLTDPVDLTL